jgi:hypothetical protein
MIIFEIGVLIFTINNNNNIIITKGIAGYLIIMIGIFDNTDKSVNRT